MKDDLISRRKAFEYFVTLWECIGTIMDRDEWEDVCMTTANEIPSAQPESCDDPRADIYYLAEKIGIHRLYALVVELRGEPEPCEDAVSRKELKHIFETWLTVKGYNDAERNIIKAALYELQFAPSVMPVQRSFSCGKENDMISRQDAIEAILAVTGNSSVRELYEHVQAHGLSDMWSGGVNATIDIIIAVPSAQPELIEKAAYIRGFEQGRTQGMIDAQERKK